MSDPVENLLSLPPAMAEWFNANRGDRAGRWFASCDPAGRKLGSGGGVAQLLADAFAADGGGEFGQWLSAAKRLVMLAGGQSRRLPAYAATGKIFMPVPVMRWSTGQRIDQALLDLQAQDYGRLLQSAPGRVLVTSGDVFLSFPRELPPVPEADVVGFGMVVSPEVARDFGVFFCPRSRPGELDFFLQKPDPARIRELARDHAFFVDTGLWLLSARAVEFLMRRCGWDGGGFADGCAGNYELYAGMGPGLGLHPAERDEALAGLTAAVVPMPQAEFHHFGTTRQMIESLSALQNRRVADPSNGDFWRKPHPDMYVLNSDFAFATRSPGHRMIWVENCALPPDLALEGENALTGVPPGAWDFRLARGVCLDVVPVGTSAWVARPYGFDDPFSGPLDRALWLGRPALEWFAARGIDPAAAGLDVARDIQECPLFARVESLDSAWISWLTEENPAESPDLRERWLAAPRVSARELGEVVALGRLVTQRRELSSRAVGAFWSHRATNPFFRVDLENAADFYAQTALPDPVPAAADPLDLASEQAFAAAVRRARGHAAPDLERKAFATLSERILDLSAAKPAIPRQTLLEDQILWARSPVRLDLAGGWSDTPPFCLKHGGAVVNLAVDLNGQAPVQVFARACQDRHIVLRSIDLGAETVLRTVEDLEACSEVGSEFSLAKAALCLAGFHPRFRSDGAATLPEMLEAFGSGLELSLLAATPKGSGLGTSSVLAATLLAALGSVGGCAWDRAEIFQRTLALEQLLTSGGGWQDQGGGLYHGIKLIETRPGLDQTPSVRWLPEDLLGTASANQVTLIYYTGITRVAKTILREIVRGMFLNSSQHLETLLAIRAHAQSAYSAIQTESYPRLCDVVARSWELNQQLDPGTNPPEVQAILDRVADWTAAAKLLGAGGGGYVLFLAKDTAAAARLRHALITDPPNPRARFVDFSISRTGLQITRS